MDRERWQRIKEIFSEAIAFGPDATLDALLGNGDDVQVADQVRQLLREHFRWAGLKSQAAVAANGTTAEFPARLADRFRVMERLGGGAFGDVYRVLDEANQGEPFAVKVLRSHDPIALRYFKQEFRSLAGVRHPNIVALYELLAHAGCWMFTMECVNGVNLIEFLDASRIELRTDTLRSTFTQLSEGIRALHQQSLLHRDLKPSNVLVANTGRVVLLDFGLVRRFTSDTYQAGTFAGTLNYMSPEQTAGLPLTEASDWYSVGVMLYQALTGRLPFYFDSFDSLDRKRREHPVPPKELDPQISPEMNDLCLHLLEVDPQKRAGFAGVARVMAGAPLSAAPEPPATRFIGREASMQSLFDALSRSASGPVCVHLRGPSGIGKSALLREWLRRIANQPRTLVFTGRCYQGESVPFQAVDDLIDHIAKYLRSLPFDRMEQFLPRNFSVLVKMFPTLASFLVSRPSPPAPPDALDLRTRAFAALRDLLGRIAEHHRVILTVDDLQWGDADGCAALNDLVSSSDSPAILAVLAYRSEDVDAAPWLRVFGETPSRTSNCSTVAIDLEALPTSESAVIAEGLLSTAKSVATVEEIVQQSGGNPFLLREMVRWMNRREPDFVLAEKFSLADVVRSRVNDVTPESRHLLELLVVAGQPTELGVLKVASGIGNVLAARDELVAARLVRVRSGGGYGQVEVYHDRIRETIGAGLDDATAALRHREIAVALEGADMRDPERIAQHYEKAGDAARCATYALQAARRFVEVLAFHQAASFFKLALQTGTLDTASRRTVLRECADSLANAGLGPESAKFYLSAGEGAAIDEELECQLLAAEQLLFTGHIDRGLAIFKTVLRQVDMTLPETPSRVPLQLLLRRAQLRIRGLRWRETSARQVPRSTLLRVDTCAAVATGLSLVDIARGATLQTTSLLLALQAGEPSRIARALAMEAAYRSTAGVKKRASAVRLITMAGELASRTGNRRAIGLTAAMSAACAWNAGLWEECYRRAHEARMSLDGCSERVVWERDTAAIFEVEGLRWMGRWSIMKAILPGLLEDARLRGDLYAQAVLQMHGGSCAALANDSPGQARDGLSVLDRWSTTGFHVEHLVETHNQVEIALYEGNGPAAMSWITKRWPALQKSLLLHVQPLNLQMHSLRARAALLAASGEEPGSRRRELLRLAAADSRSIERQGARWGQVLAELNRGGIEFLSEHPEPAIQHFLRAGELADAVGMFLHAAVARRSGAIILGGETGRSQIAEANRSLASEGILNAARLSAVIAPGTSTSREG